MGLEKKTTNITNIILVVFLVVIFGVLIKTFASELMDSEHANLSDKSTAYTSNLATGEYNNLNTTGFDGTDAPDQPLTDEGVNNKADFSLDFNFGKKSVNKYTSTLYIILNVPKFLLYDVFGFAEEGFQWVITLLNWFWKTVIGIAIVYFIRGIVK